MTELSKYMETILFLHILHIYYNIVFEVTQIFRVKKRFWRKNAIFWYIKILA